VILPYTYLEASSDTFRSSNQGLSDVGLLGQTNIFGGFSYRRCPGEQLTIQVFEDFLRKVSRDKIVFRKLNLTNPGRVPIGQNAVIDDAIGFSKSSLTKLGKGSRPEASREYILLAQMQGPGF